MSRKYFGTDGVRGRVGVSPMTPEFALKLGWAAGKVLGQAPGARVVIGKDTRRSGYVFESALESGFASAGVEVDLLGPIPTPAVAYLTKALRAQAGVVISASHNPHHDNGVKFFTSDGGKLSDEMESAIEAMLEQPMQCVEPEYFGRAKRIDDAAGRYIEFCKSTFAEDNLNGLKLVVDCAHGAAYKCAPAVFSELGAAVVHVIGDQPIGLNINQDCGSTHLDALVHAVREQQADIGIALDGDADRCLLVDAKGKVVDGDEILYIIAKSKLEQGTLKNLVVGTLMSNLGLETAIKKLGLEFQRAKVGDRYVMEMLKSSGGTLGGETSGHTLCLDKTTTGDGIVTALQVLAEMTRSRKSLEQLAAGMHKYPQVLINVPVKGKPAPILESSVVSAAQQESQKRLGDHGRILLRASGTEPLIRVMVEAENEDMTRAEAKFLAGKIEAML
jgi:phosphoglucosamine mutase